MPDLVETVLEDDRWQALGLPALATRACEAALAHQSLTATHFEISLLGCDDARIAELNQDFRNKPTPTNVLSWPAVAREAEVEGATPDLPENVASVFATELGDIAISYETCLREADEQGKPMADHVTHLMVHACLHLLGYDHIRAQDAELMEKIEVDILATLGVNNPYV